MYDGESETDGEGHEAATDVHVVLVRDGKDDDEQQESADDLVCCQGVEGNLFGILFSSSKTHETQGFVIFACSVG